MVAVCRGLLYGVCIVLCNVAIRHESGRGRGTERRVLCVYSVKEASGPAASVERRSRTKKRKSTAEGSQDRFSETGAPASWFVKEAGAVDDSVDEHSVFCDISKGFFRCAGLRGGMVERERGSEREG